MRYLHIRAGKIVNIVEYPATPPDASPEGDVIVLAPLGTESVGDNYDVTNDLNERAYSRLDVVTFKELFRISNAVRVLQGQAVETAAVYKARIKSLM